MVFTADWLNLRISRADPYLQHLLREQINALEFRFCDDLPGQVRGVLRSALLTDHARSHQVAELFSMHSRTLRRRLNDCGTSFQERLDEGRFEIARQMLQDTGTEVSQIAEALGYADASTFIPAFRRWSGSTPARWRAERLAKVNSPDWAQSCFQIAKR
ncbi:MAG: helix-turn-helix transcriptional regulator [Sedimenticolaceae bacterium]